MVKTKRVYDLPVKDDGYRVLIERLWPRGLSKDRAQIDEWCKDVAPSTALRTWYAHDPTKWEEFSHRYRAELAQALAQRALTTLVQRARQEHVTLLFSARNPELTSARILAEEIEQRLALPST
ncbi:MAG: DUF488 family protein [Chloroflexi bacterium]|nr:DUF488 family protein [Chloroflexota bacterium]